MKPTSKKSVHQKLMDKSRIKHSIDTKYIPDKLFNCRSCSEKFKTFYVEKGNYSIVCKDCQ